MPVDSVSLYPFNLCVEIMGQKIRQNKHIRGIKIGKEKVCNLQFAADNVFFLMGQKKFEIYTWPSFSDLKYSGLKPNILKTRQFILLQKHNLQTHFVTTWECTRL